MFRLNSPCTVLASALALSAATAAHADLDNCLVGPVQTIPTPAGFGSSVSVFKDVAVVGIPTYDQNRGAAAILRHNGQEWILEQVITAPDGAPGFGFGSSVAACKDAVFVGSPFERPFPALPATAGSVHVFHFDGWLWTQQTKFTPGGTPAYQLFGSAVATNGDALLVGAPQMSADDDSVGAVFVYDLKDGAWTLERDLLAAHDGGTGFGQCIALDGDTALIGQKDPELVRVFRRDGAAWPQEAVLENPDPDPLDRFGAAVAISGDTAVVGAPLSDEGAQNGGAAYVFERSGTDWSFAQTLLPPEIANGDAFGGAVAASDGAVVVGQRMSSLIKPAAIRIFRRDGPQWTFDHTAASPPADGIDLGRSIGLSDTGILTTSKRYEGNGNYSAMIQSFTPILLPDCNGDGVSCGPDLNRNLVSDDCDIASGASSDCDGDGVPDEVEAGFAYSVDDGVMDGGWGLTPKADMIGLSQFTVRLGRSLITHLAVAWLPQWASQMPNGTPAKLLLYRDPNNDGNPDDAELLETAATLMNAPPTGANALFTILPIPPTDVGGVGDSFFVGVVVSKPEGTYSPLADDTSSSPQSRTWLTIAPYGQADLSHPGAFNPLVQYQGASLLLRAVSMDCNGNGVWDACDIAGGLELDADGDGIPDACEVFVTCAADLVPAAGGNGVVDVDDLFAVINDWGPCPDLGDCRADIAPAGGNEVVDTDDLFAIINAWGSCR